MVVAKLHLNVHAVSASQLGHACPEKLRLQQLYDRAIRRWAQVMSSQLFGESTYLTGEIRKRTLARAQRCQGSPDGASTTLARRVGVKVTPAPFADRDKFLA
jgi:hypothetical protein